MLKQFLYGEGRHFGIFSSEKKIKGRRREIYKIVHSIEIVERQMIHSPSFASEELESQSLN